MANAVVLGQERTVTCAGISFCAEDGPYAPFRANSRIHVRTQCDLLFSGQFHTFFNLPGRVEIAEGWCGICEDSPYRPAAVLGGVCQTVLTKNGGPQRIPFKPRPGSRQDIFVPAGTVICQLSPIKCTVPGCKHASGDCV